MTNCTCGLAKRILDEAYRSLGAPPTHRDFRGPGADGRGRAAALRLRLCAQAGRGRRTGGGRRSSSNLTPRALGGTLDAKERRVKRNVQHRLPRSSSGWCPLAKASPNCSRHGNRAGSLEANTILVGKITREIKPFLGPYLDDPYNIVFRLHDSSGRAIPAGELLCLPDLHGRGAPGQLRGDQMPDGDHHTPPWGRGR